MKLIFLLFCLILTIAGVAQIDTAQYFRYKQNIYEVYQTQIRCFSIPQSTSNNPVPETYKISLIETFDSQPAVFKKLHSLAPRDKKLELISKEEAKGIIFYDCAKHHYLLNNFNLKKLYPNFSSNSWYVIRNSYFEIPFTVKSDDIEEQMRAIELEYLAKFDSLKIVHSVLSDMVNAYINNSKCNSRNELDELMSKLPELDSGGYGYRAAVMKKVLHANDQLYFDYVQDQPTFYDFLNMNSRQEFKLIRRSDSKAPVRKKLLKERRNNIIVGTAGLTFSLALDALIIWGVIALIN